MKRTLIALATLALVLTVACASVTGPGTRGVVTAVNGNTVTVSHGSDMTTYTMNGNTFVYSSTGQQAQRSLLTPGQRVEVWASGDKATRINIQA